MHLPTLTKQKKINTVLGRIQWETLPEDIINGPSEFHNAVNIMFDEMIQDGTVKSHVDDGSLKSGDYVEGSSPSDEDFETHLQLMDRLADTAIESGPMFKFDKCIWLQRMLELLGYRVGMGRIQFTEQRIAALLATPLPQTVTQMLSWLGGVGFIRPCLDPGFSEFVAPQRALTLEAEVKAPSSTKGRLRKSERDAEERAKQDSSGYPSQKVVRSFEFQLQDESLEPLPLEARVLTGVEIGSLTGSIARASNFLGFDCSLMDPRLDSTMDLKQAVGVNLAISGVRLVQPYGFVFYVLGGDTWGADGPRWAAVPSRLWGMRIMSRWRTKIARSLFRFIWHVLLWNKALISFGRLNLIPPSVCVRETGWIFPVRDSAVHGWATLSW